MTNRPSLLTIFKIFKIFMLILATSLIIAPLAAQPPGDVPRGGHFEEDGQRIEKLAVLLDLSTDQAEQWQSLTEAHRESARSQGEALRATREEIKDLASTAHPDLEQLGQLTLDLHRGMQAMKGLRDELDRELETILTPDQKEKLALLREARDSFGSGKRDGDRRPGRERGRHGR